MKKRYKAILKYEERIAKTLAERLTEPKEIDFGIKIIFPLLFFLDYAKIKARLSMTKKNLMLTKKLALNAAKNIKAGGKRKEELEKIITETNKLLEKERKGVYSKKVRDTQLREIDLLIDHYLKLLNAEGEKYKGLVKHAYGSKDGYFSFLKKLREEEERVNQVAIKTLKTGSKKELRKWFDRLEMTTKKVRMEEVKKIFSED